MAQRPPRSLAGRLSTRCVVLETLDAIDLAFDTFACALLAGETDTSGYPLYNAIVGGVVSHWDEATGELIVRAVVGWGGKGVRGDTDRAADAVLSSTLLEHRREQRRAGLAPVDRPVPAAGRGGLVCAHCGFAWPTSGRSIARNAGCGSSAADDRGATGSGIPGEVFVPTYDYVCVNCGHRLEVLHGVNAPGPTTCPDCGGPLRRSFSPPTIHFKGSGWAKVDRRTASASRNSRKDHDAEPAAASSDGSKSSDGATSGEGGSGSSAGSSESSAGDGSSPAGTERTKASSREGGSGDPKRKAKASNAAE